LIETLRSRTMRAMQVQAGVRARRDGVADRLDTWRDLLRSIVASDYLVVGESARFRAVQRRRVVAASRIGFLVIAAASAFDGVVLIDRDPTLGPVLLALNGAVAALALAAWWLLGGVLRRRPDPVAATVILAMAGATAITGTLIPLLAVESSGYLLLFPVLVTLIVPWSTRTHLRWLVAYAVVAMAFFLGGRTNLSAEERADLVTVELIAIGASVAGHVLLQLGAVRNFTAVRRIERLRRRADAARNELAETHRVLQETARTDPLTGARNRLRLEEDLRTIRGRMSRVGESQALIALDLDRFKAINDTQGHLAGDEVLKATVAAVRSTIRSEDEIYRFGGEEFLIVMRIVAPDGADIAAERIRREIERLAIPHPGNAPFGVVTASLGAILVTPDDLAATDDEWFARADAALYRAKAGGRNRVVGETIAAVRDRD
jgi:diguanylate cyclase (GGDEF)-like protein